MVGWGISGRNLERNSDCFGNLLMNWVGFGGGTAMLGAGWMRASSGEVLRRLCPVRERQMSAMRSNWWKWIGGLGEVWAGGRLDVVVAARLNMKMRSLLGKGLRGIGLGESKSGRDEKEILVRSW